MKFSTLTLLLALSLKDTNAVGRKFYFAMTSSKYKTEMKDYEEFKVDQVSSYFTESASSAGSCAIRCLKEKKGSCKGFQFIPKEFDGVCNLVNKTNIMNIENGQKPLYYESKKAKKQTLSGLGRGQPNMRLITCPLFPDGIPLVSSLNKN